MPSFLFWDLYREYLSETGCELVLLVAQTDLELIALFDFIPAILSTPLNPATRTVRLWKWCGAGDLTFYITAEQSQESSCTMIQDRVYGK